MDHHARARCSADDPANGGPPTASHHHGTAPTPSLSLRPPYPQQQQQQQHRMPPGPPSRERDPAARTPWWAAAAPPCDDPLLDVYWPAGMHPAFEAALATAPSASSNSTTTAPAPTVSSPQSGEPPAHVHPPAHAPTATHTLPPPQAPYHSHVARHHAADRRRWGPSVSDLDTHHSHRHHHHHHHRAGSSWTADRMVPPPPGPPSTRYDHRYPPALAHANYPPPPPPPVYPQCTATTDTHDEYARVPLAHHPHHDHASWWPPATHASAPPPAPPSAWDHAHGWYHSDEPSTLQPARKRARAAHDDENDQVAADPRAVGAAEVAVPAAAKRARQDARSELGEMVLSMPVAVTAAAAQVETARAAGPAPVDGDEADDNVDEENEAEADGEGGAACKSRRSYHVFTRKTYELMVATLLIANRHAPAASSGTSAVDRAVSALVAAKHPSRVFRDPAADHGAGRVVAQRPDDPRRAPSGRNDAQEMEPAQIESTAARCARAVPVFELGQVRARDCAARGLAARDSCRACGRECEDGGYRAPVAQADVFGAEEHAPGAAVAVRNQLRGLRAVLPRVCLLRRARLAVLPALAG
ncbi:hypothetical protein AMAG_13947 [Allomyces macrogynus ATCC 38327]|uniref:Uncharacterized protein n=1 Tax=Allomyces macrogynus (strain ATCC 38327) TaxID=578462 RepID=A0A0L0T2W8_ALLM3|nr:hypothetical protein AMAG_13947 [Allomyces macrogynus ATCC 38327]|eukprot:KNE69076.1 hypothetical protein AMAG_13947 [Allomyces macrogynus ATCC 38327]